MRLFDLLIKILRDDESRMRSQEGEELKGFRGLLRVLSGHFHHPTVYNPLGILAGAAYLASILNPWWHASVTGAAFVGGRRLDAFAYFLKHNVPPEGWRYIIETPLPASVALICGLLGYFLLVLWGGTMAGKKGKLFVACGGFFMLIYTAGFFATVYFACYRVGGTPLEDFKLYATFPVTVHPRFLPPYYHAIIAAVVCLLSSFIHGRLPIRLYRKKGNRSRDPENPR
jgi:hypothetical protein